MSAYNWDLPSNDLLSVWSARGVDLSSILVTGRLHDKVFHDSYCAISQSSPEVSNLAGTLAFCTQCLPVCHDLETIELTGGGSSSSVLLSMAVLELSLRQLPPVNTLDDATHQAVTCWEARLDAQPHPTHTDLVASWCADVISTVSVESLEIKDWLHRDGEEEVKHLFRVRPDHYSALSALALRLPSGDRVLLHDQHQQILSSVYAVDEFLSTLIVEAYTVAPDVLVVPSWLGLHMLVDELDINSTLLLPSDDEDLIKSACTLVSDGVVDNFFEALEMVRAL